MEINNFNQIKDLLIFESSDWFYHLQILLRRKDMPEASRGRNNNARCIKTYYITSKEYLVDKQEEIIKLCNVFGARAYINLNAKSFEKVTFELNAQLADRMKYKQFNYCYRLYETVVGGGYSSEDEFDTVLTDKEKETIASRVNVGPKRWIVDVDDDDKDIPIHVLLEDIDNCLPKQGSATKIQAIIPTKSGNHIITSPFNIQEFKAIYPKMDIQKNNPTVIYFNKIKE